MTVHSYEKRRTGSRRSERLLVVTFVLVDLRAFRVVVAVAEQGSVTRAATSLHQSSSAVSHTLLGLEAELGVDLFYRLPRGMALTDAGTVFVAAARRAMHEAEVARRSVDAIRGLVAGQLSVAAVLGFSVGLASLVGDFASRYPRVVVRVFPPDSTDGVAELVRSGACEVGFTWSAVLPDDLDGVLAAVDPSVVVVPAGHRLGGQAAVSLGDLRGERMVAPLITSTMRPVFDALFRRHGVEPDVVAEAATNEMVLELVREGVGCTVTFASSVAPVVGRGALSLGITDHPPNHFLLITRKRQDPTPAARAFCELAAQHFPR
ncbi:MAG: LysR family transcriptional regulator [Acidimicrobiales bacterium]